MQAMPIGNIVNANTGSAFKYAAYIQENDYKCENIKSVRCLLLKLPLQCL